MASYILIMTINITINVSSSSMLPNEIFVVWSENQLHVEHITLDESFIVRSIPIANKFWRMVRGSRIDGESIHCTKAFGCCCTISCHAANRGGPRQMVLL